MDAGIEPVTTVLPARFSVAPMLEWTDRHCRYLLRLLTRHALLYTEMVTTGAILRGDRERWLKFDPAEHPVALQLGGGDPRTLAACARIGADRGYDEINLNVGCPSDRVRSGRFGACLMAEPDRVAECISAMRNAVAIPVTVKTRTGIDDRDCIEDLFRFVRTVSRAGCGTFIIHARNAWLKGLSPKENRTIPPLKYADVHRVKRQFPGLRIIVNGGITGLEAAAAHLEVVDGVMLGRAVYHQPWLLTGVDARFFNDPHPLTTRAEIVERMIPYIERELCTGTPLKHIARHMLGLFQGVPGARHWRRQLSHEGPKRGSGIAVIHTALAATLACSRHSGTGLTV
jgi:tRNA-dihydrouridine synthase A